MYYRSYYRHCCILCLAVALCFDMHKKRYFCINLHRCSTCNRRIILIDLRLYSRQTNRQTWTCVRCGFCVAYVYLYHFRFCALQQCRTHRLRLAYDDRLCRFVCVRWCSCVKQKIKSLQKQNICYNIKACLKKY